MFYESFKLTFGGQNLPSGFIAGLCLSGVAVVQANEAKSVHSSKVLTLDLLSVVQKRYLKFVFLFSFQFLLLLCLYVRM